MKTSKDSGKSQVTLPKEVRAARGADDTIASEVEGDVVRIKRPEPFDAEFHWALSNTLSEWATDEDEDAFGSNS